VLGQKRNRVRVGRSLAESKVIPERVLSHRN
jgi:hypothetical protein